MKTVLLASAASLALITGAYAMTAPPAHPPMSIKAPSTTAMHVVPHNGSTTLYSQNGSTASSWPASNNLTSGEFTSDDSAGADDFVLPSGKYTISQVYAPGESYGYFGYAYPTSMDVTFYKKIKVTKKGAKAKVLLACNDEPYTNEGGLGDFLVDISSCAAGTKFKGGKDYYVSVVANNNYADDSGYWFWQSRRTQTNGPGMWENEGGAFGICPSWNTNAVCFTSGLVGPDYVFELYGSSKK
ncbi:MAG TPA: hypothetical protein VHX61_17350 [Rhizomicrobium sp.]|jgi:hypothetical protein|nr:hypothetical protein [Rhizomicrobium sp.]